jgi:hypothetical protein
MNSNKHNFAKKKAPHKEPPEPEKIHRPEIKEPIKKNIKKIEDPPKEMQSHQNR